MGGLGQGSPGEKGVLKRLWRPLLLSIKAAEAVLVDTNRLVGVGVVD